MEATDLQKYIGKTAALDLVNGTTITCRVESVSDKSVKVRKPVVFALSMGMTPNELQVSNLPYGAPLFKLDEFVNIKKYLDIDVFTKYDIILKHYSHQEIINLWKDDFIKFLKNKGIENFVFQK